MDALRLLGVGQGRRVLLPSFICWDLFAPITMLGATPRWYELKPGLAAAGAPDTWPDADAVLAVNYFGLAQELVQFIAYSNRTGAKLIEDNAHWYLSRDATGRWLGTRAPVGLFSVCATLRVLNGVVLLDSLSE